MSDSTGKLATWQQNKTHKARLELLQQGLVAVLNRSWGQAGKALSRMDAVTDDAGKTDVATPYHRFAQLMLTAFAAHARGDMSLRDEVVQRIQQHEGLATNQNWQSLKKIGRPFATGLRLHAYEFQRQEGFENLVSSDSTTLAQVLSRSADGVKELRKNLASRAWTASYDEPLDGGVADVAKHFTTLLKAAERRRVGLALRTHR